MIILDNLFTQWLDDFADDLQHVSAELVTGVLTHQSLNNDYSQLAYVIWVSHLHLKAMSLQILLYVLRYAQSIEGPYFKL